MISIDRTCYEKMRILCEYSKIEVCGTALYKSDLIYGFSLTEYVGAHNIGNDRWDLATGVHVVSDVLLLAKKQQEARKQQAVLVDWHSHNSMAAFWSGTDENNIRTFPNEYQLISIVTNHKGDILLRKDTSYFTGIETRHYKEFALTGKGMGEKKRLDYLKEIEKYYSKRKEFMQQWTKQDKRISSEKKNAQDLYLL